MAEKRKRGRKKKDESAKLMRLLAEFSQYQLLSKVEDEKMNTIAETWKTENGYKAFFDKNFCEKHNMNLDYPTETRKKTDYWDIFWESVTNKERAKLPLAMSILMQKAPETWVKLAFPRQSNKALTQKMEVSGTQKVINLNNLSYEELHVLKYGKKPA